MVQISEFLLTVAAKASQNSQYVRNKEHREAAKQNARGFAGNILEVRLLGCGILMVSPCAGVVMPTNLPVSNRLCLAIVANGRCCRLVPSNNPQYDEAVKSLWNFDSEPGPGVAEDGATADAGTWVRSAAIQRALTSTLTQPLTASLTHVIGLKARVKEHQQLLDKTLRQQDPSKPLSQARSDIPFTRLCRCRRCP